jgi:RISC-loading complex subunit TARBP2
VGDIIPANGNGNVEEEIELAKNVANMKLDTLTQKHSKVLQDFYKKLQESGKAKLLALHRSSLREINLDYVRLLAELGQEQGFEITYVNIEERSASGENQCLVQLSTLPVAVCYGVGQNQATANNDAARHALNYLKLMTKKSTQNPDQQMANKAKSKATNGK